MTFADRAKHLAPLNAFNSRPDDSVAERAGALTYLQPGDVYQSNDLYELPVSSKPEIIGHPNAARLNPGDVMTNDHVGLKPRRYAA